MMLRHHTDRKLFAYFHCCSTFTATSAKEQNEAKEYTFGRPTKIWKCISSVQLFLLGQQTENSKLQSRTMNRELCKQNRVKNKKNKSVQLFSDFEMIIFCFWKVNEFLQVDHKCFPVKFYSNLSNSKKRIQATKQTGSHDFSIELLSARLEENWQNKSSFLLSAWSFFLILFY